jgi:ApaG protein
MKDSPLNKVVVNVRTQYLDSQSVPENHRFVFAYHITITNHGAKPVQLLRRHWIITDSNNVVEEVEGEGVIGQQPVIESGHSYDYTSGCILKTDCGTMEGVYQMKAHDGTLFDARILPFALRIPGTLH